MATASARVSGPILPISIVSVISNFPTTLRLCVMPVVRPTVPNAEVVSKSTLIKELPSMQDAFSVMERIMAMQKIQAIERANIINAL